MATCPSLRSLASASRIRTSRSCRRSPTFSPGGCGRAADPSEPGGSEPVLVLDGPVELVRGLELLPLAVARLGRGAREQLLALLLAHRLERRRQPEGLLEHALAVAAGDGDAHSGNAHRIAQAVERGGSAGFQDQAGPH